MDPLTEIGIVVVCSLLGSIIAIKYKFPPVAGLLVAGAIIGPHALDLVKSSDVISVFSQLGSILLLFGIGIEFSLSKILKHSLRALLVGIFKVGIVFLISYLLLLAFGLSVNDAMIVGVLLSVTSTAIFINFVQQPQYRDRQETGLLLAVLIVEDIISIGLLTFFESLKIEAVKSISRDILVPIAISVVVLGVAYVVLERIVKWFLDTINCYEDSQSLILAAFSIAAVLSFVAMLSGLSFGIGAFLAGSMVASVQGFKKVEPLIMPFNNLFASFFFFTIGMLFDWRLLVASFGLIVAVNLINLMAKFTGTSLSTYLFGFDSKQAVFAGLTMLSVGEFSLLLAKEASGYTSIDIVSIISATVLISALFSAKLPRFEANIDSLVLKALPQSQRGALKNISSYFDRIITYMEPGGLGFRRFISCGTRIVFSGSVAAIVFGAGIVLSRAAGHFLGTIGGVAISDIVFAVGFLVAVIPALVALRAFRDMLSTVAEAFVQQETGKIGGLTRRAEQTVGLFILFFLFSFFIPAFVALIQLPPAFNSIALVPLCLSVIFLLDTARTIARIFKEKRLARVTLLHRSRKGFF